MANGYLDSAIAEAVGANDETIGHCERIGLLPAPARTRGNYRSYRREHLERLGFIRRARKLGFTLDQVRMLLGLSDRRDAGCRAVDAIARDRLAEVERKIADLESLRRELRELLGQCGQRTVADCRIIDALSPRKG